MISEEDKIYVDGGQQAALLDGDKSVEYISLIDAFLAWDRLPATRKTAASIKVKDRLYSAAEIVRLYYERKRGVR